MLRIRPWILFGALLLIIAIALAMIQPHLGPRGPTSAMVCSSNLGNLFCALMSYHDRFGSLPPVYVPDSQGKPAHSWRVLLLPHLDLPALYDAYDFQHHWLSPANDDVRSTHISILRCAAEFDAIGALTNYVAVSGPGTLFDPTHPISLDDLTPDQRSRTILLVEVVNGHFNWAEPRDLTLDTISPYINDHSPDAISSHHRRGAHVLMADGTVRFLPNSFDPGELKRMLTVRGRDQHD